MPLSLKKIEKFPGRPGPLVLAIMDGVGIGRQDESNAVYLAKTPTLDALFAMPLYTQLQAHGVAVGLPSDDDMGNSEIGHNALGSGRVFDQGAKLVNRAILMGEMFEGENWKRAVQAGVDGHTLHFVGLHSDGNVHSNTVNQLYPMLRKAAEQGVKRCRLHILHDGRDVPPRSALEYIAATEAVLAEVNSQYHADFRIASGGGRMVTTMDRYEADWKIVERGWNAHVHGDARHFASAAEAVQTMYDEADATAKPGEELKGDQYLDPFVIAANGQPVGKIVDGDAVVFFNFRGDRAIEITIAFEEGDGFTKFDRRTVPQVFYAGMMQYDGDLKLPKNYLVDPPQIDRTFCEYLAAERVRMLAVSETQKYGHVTYFWNGNKSGYIDDSVETYHEIPSDENITFDQAPKMKAVEITDWVEEQLRTQDYRFARLNYANGDMVGHTGSMEATITAVETVDASVARLLTVVKELRGILVVTADHGNSDEMWTEKNGKRQVKTAHTLNPVPFCIVDPLYNGEYRMADLNNPGLANVAATILNLLGYEAPEGYCPSLIQFHD